VGREADGAGVEALTLELERLGGLFLGLVLFGGLAAFTVLVGGRVLVGGLFDFFVLGGLLFRGVLFLILLHLLLQLVLLLR